MTRFISQSACHGQRPTGIAPQRMVSRPHLISRLLENRGALRALVAPDGFGKAALACEYAEMMFGFTHVFWINGASPCFLRDLDAEVVESSLLESDPACALVVFADIPWLDDERARALSEVVDHLLERKVEVLAIMRPLCDRLEALQANRLLIDGHMLLVTSEEARADMLAPLAVIRGERDFERRIPCLRWSSDGLQQLIQGCRADRLPSDMSLALWAILVLGRGTLQDLQFLLGQRRGKEVWDALADAYPFAGIEPGEDVFVSVPMDMDVLFEGFGRAVAGLGKAAGHSDGDELVVRIAGWLARRGQGRRAVDLLGCFATRSATARWLDQHGWDLLWWGEGQGLQKLYGRIARQRLEYRPLTNAMMAWALVQNGEGGRALSFAQRVLDAPDSPLLCRVVAALCGRVGGNTEVRTTMENELVAYGCADDSNEEVSPTECLLESMVSLAIGREEGLHLCETWQSVWKLLQAGAGRGFLCDGAERAQAALLGASWVVEALASQGAFDPQHEDKACLADDEFRGFLAECVRLLEEVAAVGNPLGYGGRRAAEALELMGESFTLAMGFAVPTAIEAALAAVRSFEASCAVEGTLRGERLSRTTEHSPRRRTDPRGRDGLPGSMNSTAPLLHVKLFGSMKVTIGGEEVSESLLAKRQARLLLALLVLNRGRDLTREEIAGTLWPCSEPRTALKSFYRLWQDLARMLSVQGTCPYLLRDRQRCRLNTALFTSDVMEFEVLMRTLLFGLSPSAAGWESVLGQVQETFASELMPGEERCAVVASSRRQFASDLVDGLVAVSNRLRKGGNTQAALWFAREASRREHTREDVYETLMAAQIVSGQRSAAMETYLACCSFLSEEMGLDPSERLRALHHALLEGTSIDCC